MNQNRGTPNNYAGILVLGVSLLLFGSYFSDPHRLPGLGSPILVFAALGAHLGGAILVVIGLYRLYRSRRGTDQGH